MAPDPKPLASGIGSMKNWRIFILANRALNATLAESRAYRRRVHELSILDPHYAARRRHPNAGNSNGGH